MTRSRRVTAQNAIHRPTAIARLIEAMSGASRSMKNLRPLLSHANDRGIPVNNRATAKSQERRRSNALVCASTACPDAWDIPMAGGSAN